MEIKTDALFKKEIKKCIEYALQEFGLKTARKWQTQYKEIKRLLEFMPKRYPIVAISVMKQWSFVVPSS